MNSKYLLQVGTVIPLIFFGTTIVCGLIQGNYNHLSRLVSELGTQGTNSQYVFTVGLVSCSILSVLFFKGLYGVCRSRNISVAPVIILLTFSVSIGGAGIFPLPLPMHGIIGMPSVLMILSPLTSFIFWNDQNSIPKIRLMSVVSFSFMSLGFLAFFPDVLINYAGLKQRFFHVGWSIWFLYLSLGFVKTIKNDTVNSVYS